MGKVGPQRRFLRLSYRPLSRSSLTALSSSSLARNLGTSKSFCSKACFSSCRAKRLSASSSVLVQSQSPKRDALDPQDVASHSVVLQNHGMVLPQRWSMTDRHESDSES